MKNIVLTLAVLLSLNLFGQRERILNLQNFESETRFNWGYYIGLSRWDFKLDPVSNASSNIVVKGSTGLSVGLMGMMNINKYLDFRIEPGLHFVSRTLTFENVNIPETDRELKVKSTYLDIPFLVHFRGARWNNVRPFVATGIGYMRNLQANETTDDDASKGVFRMKENNFNWQAEAGVELYFKRFKMTPAIKGIFMINDEMIPDNQGTEPYWNGSISNLRSRAIMFSLKFE
ncbi:MAG: porin family protein [Flavobacteriales bacterium]